MRTWTLRRHVLEETLGELEGGNMGDYDSDTLYTYMNLLKINFKKIEKKFSVILPVPGMFLFTYFWMEG